MVARLDFDSVSLAQNPKSAALGQYIQLYGMIHFTH
tara:strand:- start:620 stop:727 length:108 start_codon:yes stop_codon:yes gene_type:complete